MAEDGISVIAIKKKEYINIAPKADDIIEFNDIIVAIGSSKDLSKFDNLIKK